MENSRLHIGFVWLIAIWGCKSVANEKSQDEGTTKTPLSATAQKRPEAKEHGGATVSPLTIESPAFTHKGEIPAKHTCKGTDVSVPLRWSAVPTGAKSLALIVDDPDAPDPNAPKMVWVHWVLYNLPASSKGLEEAVSSLPPGTQEGLNDWKRTSWSGPCPPIGRHRYFFKLYALDILLPDLAKPTKAQLLEAMEGHIVAQGDLMGTFQK